ncbi:MAG: hypothetical protein RJA36_367 [Pseudomonadota bacterium]|jgi:hypothetical protein
MTDREMLEAAARAAGQERSVAGDLWSNARGMPWNPLTDDGDALRLAVQLGLEVGFVDDEPGNDGRYTRASVGYSTESDPRVRYVFEDHRGDIFAATRRAIVRAAAAMDGGQG